MQYTFLGRTGVSVSRVCLGCMSFGAKSWRPWVLEEEDSKPYFRQAVESGINFFDTADVYSLGESERITGKWLKEFARLEECVVATKAFFEMGPGPNMKGLSRKHIQQACEASLKRLGLETIDIYQLHRFDKHTPMEETLAALDLLVRQGKVRYIGCSSTWAWRFAQALSQSERNGWARFVTMQNHYNLLYREEEREMLPLCEAEGVASIPWSPLARGILARARTTFDEADSQSRQATDDFARKLYDHPSDIHVVEALKEVAGRRGDTPAQIALAWLLSKPVVAAPIIGVTRLDHLTDAVKAVDLELSEQEIAALETPYQPHGVRGL
ncbi:aldo/keto reductase [Lignipirellula cremea]|uniref:L-glyceraldehyde 3-phosphate reductase n=1 Tax=Lignipirellula cremea TaxID=2528010 RepID=A0A518DXV9_9BACT|nr:aldo/keto reductase [Lignipirellula cremea]QDU96680.1 L-glyceraldehyde 3-phosphate reductase [Lignipirellula cremea]